jgi:hypothetical protein
VDFTGPKVEGHVAQGDDAGEALGDFFGGEESTHLDGRPQGWPRVLKAV